jgi:phage-related minor tail protein
VSAGKNYLVGERGPEIFSPSSSGSIIPNHRAGGSVSNDNRTINITINASPGMNERTLADLVLARLDGRQAALAGGALYD